jgi:hypothetical protein
MSFPIARPEVLATAAADELSALTATRFNARFNAQGPGRQAVGAQADTITATQGD